MSTPTSDNFLDTALAGIGLGNYVVGHTWDGFAGVKLSGVNVTMQQSGVNYTTISDTNAAWNFSNQMLSLGIPVYFLGNQGHLCSSHI
jgi:hypothetical protein